MFPRYSVSSLLVLPICQADIILHSQYTAVSLQFVPVLKAYFVPENFYVEGEVLTMPIPTDPALKVDIHSLSKDQKFFISIDGTNRAEISKEEFNEAKVHGHY